MYRRWWESQKELLLMQGRRSTVIPTLLTRAQPFVTELGIKDKSSSKAQGLFNAWDHTKRNIQKKPVTKTTGVQQEHDLSASTEGSRAHCSREIIKSTVG